MSDVTGKWLDTHVFDSNLFQLGEWDDQSTAKIKEWLRTIDINEKLSKASELFAFLVPHFLGGDYSTYNSKVNELSRNLIHFEQLIVTTKSGLASEFYRDHLNHMIRVMLLARAIAVQMKNSGLKEEYKEILPLIGLFHDAAYPLQEARLIFTEIQVAMRNCYYTMAVYETPLAYDEQVLLENIKCIPIPGKDLSFFAPYLKEYNHAVIGAFEFLNYIKSGKRKQLNYKLAAQAIALHDANTDIPIKFSQNPLLALLILCDEMQDWGRPVGFGKEPTLADLKDFKVCEAILQATLDFSGIDIFAPLRQIRGKWKNLKRLCLDGAFPQLKIQFLLPSYERIDLSHFIEILKQFFSSDQIKEQLHDTRVQQVLSLLVDSRVELKIELSILIDLLIDFLDSLEFEYKVFIDKKSAEALVISKKGGLPSCITVTKAKDGRLQMELIQKDPYRESVGTLNNDIELHEIRTSKGPRPRLIKILALMLTLASIFAMEPDKLMSVFEGIRHESFPAILLAEYSPLYIPTPSQVKPAIEEISTLINLKPEEVQLLTDVLNIYLIHPSYFGFS